MQVLLLLTTDNLLNFRKLSSKKNPMKRSFTMILRMVLFLVFGMGKMNAQSNVMSGSSENVLGVKVPKIESFVLVTNEEGADIFKSSSADSPWRVIWLENVEGAGQTEENERYEMRVPHSTG